MIMGFFSRNKTEKPEPLFDPEQEFPIMRCSICNGERVAGFKNRQTGKFREYGVIRNDKELEEFKKHCGVNDIPKEY